MYSKYFRNTVIKQNVIGSVDLSKLNVDDVIPELFVRFIKKKTIEVSRKVFLKVPSGEKPAC